jgi:hypothetical protein
VRGRLSQKYCSRAKEKFKIGWFVDRLREKWSQETMSSGSHRSLPTPYMIWTWRSLSAMESKKRIMPCPHLFVITQLHPIRSINGRKRRRLGPAFVKKTRRAVAPCGRYEKLFAYDDWTHTSFTIAK